MENNIKKNLNDIRTDIKNHSIHPEKVKIICVSKYVDSKQMKDVYDQGVETFGENVVQSLRAKYEDFKDFQIKDAKWHFIGNLQKNKVKYIIDKVELIHSVNKLSLAKEIDKRAAAISQIMDVLLEINIIGEESKEGYSLDTLKEDIDELLKLKNINVIGLMTMAPFTDDENIQRECFRGLSDLMKELNKNYFKDKLTELSMGMTNDYKIALEEGATLIRMGRKIFY